MTERLQAAIPETNPLPVEVWTQDESRWGLMTVQRRRITARGVKPVATIQHDYANSWLYGSVAPTTGERFFLILPELNAATMQIFMDEFAAAHPTTFNLLLLDNSAAHTATTLRMPANLGVVCFEPYCPELNPTERVWQDLRGKLANQTFADLELLEDELCAHLATYDAATIQSLTSYPYLIEAIHAIGS